MRLFFRNDLANKIKTILVKNILYVSIIFHGFLNDYLCKLHTKKNSVGLTKFPVTWRPDENPAVEIEKFLQKVSKRSISFSHLIRI